MTVVVNLPEPSEKQREFYLKRQKHIGYGGARGGGKSHGVRHKAIGLGFEYAGITIGIVRRTYPELQKNHIEPLKKILHADHPDKRQRAGTYNQTDKVMRLRNGSKIYFLYCDNERQLGRFQGLEFDVLFIDEATQFPEEWIKKMVASVRGVNDFPKRIYYTMNPGGVGHAYMKRLFIDRKYERGEKPEDYVFVKALVTDNKALMEADPTYVEQLEALPGKLRKAWLNGSWDIFEGQFFEEFIETPPEETAKEMGLTVQELIKRRQWTHVIEPFDIPRSWPIHRSFDWGYSKPFSCAWWTMDYDGVLYRIAELYGCTKEPNTGVKWGPNKVFEKIKEIEDTHPYLKGKKITGVADPSIWSKETGPSVEETAASHGIYFSKGDNARIPGWLQVHYRLAFDDNGYPMMYVFNTCKAFIRTIPLQVYDETHVEDLDTDMEDHVADETRYMCMSRPIPPRQKTVGRPLEDDPLNMIADMNKRR